MEDYYNQIFRMMPVPCQILKVVGSSFVIVECNDFYLQATGAKKEDFLDKLAEEVFIGNPEHGKDETELLLQSFKKVKATEKKDKVEISGYDILQGNPGKTIWSAENYPLLNKKGEVEYILHTVQDITEQTTAKIKKKALYHQLDIRDKKYRHFIEENPDAIYVLDTDGNFLYVNEGVSRITETSKEELLGMDFLPFCTPRDREKILENFDNAVKGNPIDFEANFVSAKGKEMILHISYMPVQVNEAGHVTAIYAIAKDVTLLHNSQKITVEKVKFLEVNALFISSLLQNERLEDEVLNESFEVVGKAMRVDRMYYFGTSYSENAGEDVIRMKIEWTNDGISPQIDNPDMLDIPVSQVGEIMGHLAKNEAFKANLNELPEGFLRDIFLDQNIKSMLLLPVFVQNDLVGLIGFDDCIQERNWREDEISFLKSLTHNLSNAMENKASKKALKLQEEQLKRSEEKFKALVQEGSDLIAIINLEGVYKFVSESSTTILGIEPEEFIGKNAFEFIHPEDLDRVWETFSALDSKKQIKISPFRFKDGQGHWRWIETTATNMIDDPAVNGIVANSKDIHKELGQAQEIKEINERYRLAATATKDIIYDCDLEKNQSKEFHNSLKDILGYSAEEVSKNKFWNKNIHPEDFEREQEKLKMSLADKNENFLKSKYRFKRADGSYANVIDKGYIIRNKKGKAIRIVGAVTDISDLTAKEEALKIANMRFKRAMKATNEMIWDWDFSTGRVIRSKGYSTIFHYPREKSNSGSKDWERKIVLEDRERVKESFKRALASKKQRKWKEEYRFEKGNGEIAYVIDRGYIVRGKNGEAIRMVGAVLDVTESRRLIGEIKTQNGILREIAWEQAHLVRGPLARLKGLLPLLKEEDNEWTREEVLEHIFTSADELDEVVKGIISKTEKIEVN